MSNKPTEPHIGQIKQFNAEPRKEPMTITEIIKQLLNGNHLQPAELKRAEKILHALIEEVENRLERK